LVHILLPDVELNLGLSLICLGLPQALDVSEQALAQALVRDHFGFIEDGEGLTEAHGRGGHRILSFIQEVKHFDHYWVPYNLYQVHLEQQVKAVLLPAQV